MDGSPVAWHLLIGTDEARVFAPYATLFGWKVEQVVDLGEQRGKHQLFAWDTSGTVAGVSTDLARRPGIHTQWLFFFPVPDIERARSKVRELGGIALDPTRTATGQIVAPCEDPQGAAFGLYQPA